MKIYSFKNLTGLACTILLSTLYSQGQVKIGSNPTSISTNTNLEIEADNGSKTVIKKGGGNVGINTSEPSDLLHVRGTEGAHNIVLDRDHGNSSVTLRSEGGITVRRVGPNMAAAQHVGGYLDLVGIGGTSPGWRVAQFANFFAIAEQASNQLNQFPFYIHNGGRISIGSSNVQSSAQLTVDGQIAATGYSTRNGTNGANTNNSFNIYWNGTNATLWIDGANQGIIQTSSDYRLKKNISPIENSALQRVKQLKPVNFEYKDIHNDIYKSDHIKYEGFVAHELQAVIPSAVNGEKDAVTEKGKIQPQTVNAMPVVAILTKAIQELEAKVEKLEQENDQLRAQASTLEAISIRISELEASLGNNKYSASKTSLTEK